jgi:hypothetical protein
MRASGTLRSSRQRRSISSGRAIAEKATIAEVDKLFADGVDAVTLARAEWDAIQSFHRATSRTG